MVFHNPLLNESGLAGNNGCFLKRLWKDVGYQADYYRK